jgi:hypothetical protein
MNANYSMVTVDNVDNIALEIAHECRRAGSMFPPMHSPHEAAFVIEEEWEEYRQEVFKHNMSKPGRDTRPRQREELIQLAAMCMRAIIDTIDAVKEVPCRVEFHAKTNVGLPPHCGETLVIPDDSPSGGCIR